MESYQYIKVKLFIENGGHMNQVKRFLREVALNVSRLTEEIADKLDDKEKQEETSQKENTVTQTPQTPETPEIKETQEASKNKEENITSTKVEAEKEPSAEEKANEAEDKARQALNDSEKRRDEENKIFSRDEDAFLIDGEDYVEKAEEKKHDIEYMKKCCALELKKMKEKNEVPAIFYFERVAILSKKEKNYEQEVKYCEDYIKALDEFYENNKDSSESDVRKTAKYHSLVKRMEKAKDLISRK